jgi:hypothetical protein
MRKVLMIVGGFFLFVLFLGAIVPKQEREVSASEATAHSSRQENGNGTSARSASRNAAKVGSRENPVPYGESLLIKDQKGEFEVAVVDVQRLDAAAVKRLNMFNKDPEVGHEFVSIKMHLRYVSGKDAYKTPASGASVLYQGRMWGAKGFSVGPEPKFGGVDLFPGGEAEGWISLLQVPEGASPLVLNWGQSIVGGGGNWFELPADL